MKTTTILVVAGIAVLGIGAYFFLGRRSSMKGPITSNLPKQHVASGELPPALASVAETLKGSSSPIAVSTAPPPPPGSTKLNPFTGKNSTWSPYQGKGKSNF